ncbi:MAG: amidase [Gammaproteobacteria bacterium]|nr:amidase [Gammaproteobacteria bacterium]
MTSELHRLSLVEAARGIASGRFTSLELVMACLERIHAREEQVGAWAWLDPDQALAQARACDPRSATTPMHGVPVGVKDIIDTADMPTCYGSQIYAGHYPDEDAECIRLLRQAGAVIMGKTVTTEFAFYAPGKTANPHNLEHTPGGSSSGSAAAVADFHVPLALGTQTSGSIIRPASFNGVFGCKPTYNSYSLDGIQPLAPDLDTLGAFSRSPADIALLHGVLAGRQIQAPETVRPATVALVCTPAWDDADAQVQENVLGFADRLKQEGIDVIEPDEKLLNGLMEVQQAYLARGAATSLGHITDRYPDQVRPQTRDLVAEGRRVGDSFNARLQDALARGERFLSEVFCRADLVITPSAPGEAPAGLHNTGNPMFNRIWTFLQTPCMNLPLTRGANGLPIGMQLVCNKQQDERLFAYSEYLKNLTDYAIEQP